jgi:5,6,7,8-tetrahydromethanopterin hydro-lyase
MQVGEGFVGEGPDLAHVNTLVGRRDGPVGAAFATALATPSAGHAPFLVILQPGLPVQPPTLFVNKAAIAGDVHGALTWGAAQAGVAAGVADAVAEGVIRADLVDTLVVVAAVWVNPAATDAAAVEANNRAAIHAALEAGVRGSPPADRVVAARDDAWNPYLRPR